ncbi:MAG TPA: ABC transporter substrate-binding protein [Candidatus Binataceae bacterium]|nr:ABC transporter substrate-binding protein [Candidatus Binataceae bacterium]
MRVLARLLLVAVFLVAGGSLNAQTLPVIRIAALPIDVSGEVFYAADLGYFKDAGLDAQVTILTNGAAVSAALIGGAFDVGASQIISASLAHEKGIDLKIVAPGALYESKAPTTVCAVAPNSPLTGPKDLEGKTFGVPDLGGLPRIAISAWMEKAGADPASVKLVEIPFAAMVPAMASGRIDAGILVNPLLQHALDAGQAKLLGKCLDAVAPQFAIAEYYALGSYAGANPQIVRKFEQVIERTARWANAHHAESAAILERWTKSTLPPTAARAFYAERLSVADFQPEIDAAARWKVIKASFPVSEIFARS